MTLDAGSATALAVDIGGTKMAAALVDERGRMGPSQRIATPRTADGEELFDALAHLIGRVADGVPALRVVGVGCGGPMDAPLGAVAPTVSPLNIPAWREFPLAARLAAETSLPVAVDNDAKALALGEGWVGAARGRRSFLALVVSTGVGAGIVLDGRLLDGDLGNAGHLGHVIVEPGGRRCECGAHGCLEAEASGTAIAAITGRPASEAPDAVRSRTGTLVGRAVASVVNLLDLGLACVAGSVALGYGATFLAAARSELAASAQLTFSRRAEIRIGGLGADGPLVGAAAVGWRSIGADIGVT